VQPIILRAVGYAIG